MISNVTVKKYERRAHRHKIKWLRYQNNLARAKPDSNSHILYGDPKGKATAIIDVHDMMHTPQYLGYILRDFKEKSDNENASAKR